MIDPKILNILKSNLEDPSYSILIQSFYQPELCNKDELQTIIYQVNPNFFDIITNKNNYITLLKEALERHGIPIPQYNELFINNIVRKKFIIGSTLKYDQGQNMFTSGLTGYIESETNEDIPSQSSHGYIKNKRITFTNKDVPNILDNHHFTLTKEKFIIELADEIKNITVTITHDDLDVTYQSYHTSIPFTPFVVNTITDNQIVIDMEDIRETLRPIGELNEIDNIIKNKTITIDELHNHLIADTADITSQQQQDNAEILEQINTLNQEIANYEDIKEAIMNRIAALNFTSIKPFNFDIEYTCQDDITTNTIECANFKLQASIHIDFLNTYRSLPSVILTIDKKNKLYSSYDTTFTTNNNGEYNGVTISFNNLKRIRDVIEVNALIIGDAVD